MSAFSSLALAILIWLGVSLAWAALTCALSTFGARRFEGWSSYWLAWLVIAAAPPLIAPIFLAAPLAIAPAQLDAALALAEWTAPVQRAGLDPAAWIDAAAAALALVFAAGVLVAGTSLVRDLRMAAARRMRARPLAGGTFEAGADVLVADEATAIFCLGGTRPAIVLSREAVRTMAPAQLRMVVSHELAHVKRGDPYLFAVLCALDALFWFNPFVRRLTGRVRLAAEISCDAIALEDSAAAARKAYAAAFLGELERGASATAPLAAFGPSPDIARARLNHILAGRCVRRGRALSAVLLMGVCMTCLPSAAVAASTLRMAAFGDPTLLWALDARLARLYGAPQCEPSGGAPFEQQ